MLNVRLNINMTMTKAPPSAAAELETLMADVRRLSLESSAAWTDSDLTLTQMRALAIIQLRQPITVGALSALMGMSLASGSALADRLVRAGLLKRRHDPDDRRQVLLELESEGAALLHRIEQHSRAKMRRAVAVMEPHEREALATALGGFIRILREERGGLA
jgi:DNA-binding MarR family transcriptional regulator